MLIMAVVFFLGFSSQPKGGNAAPVGLAENPGFTLNTLAGEPVDLDSYLGNTPVLVVFWASWCPPCKREIPLINELRQQYGENELQIFAVNINESIETVSSFARDWGINYTVLMDRSAEVADQYGVRGIPTNVLFDRDGNIQYYGHSFPDQTIDLVINS